MSSYIYEIVSICIFTVLSALVSIAILHNFTSKHKPPLLILVILWYSYTLSLSALSLLSVDVADGLFTTKINKSNSPKHLQIVWKVFYWSIQLLAWILLPVCQSYLTQGHFTWYRKLLGAIIANILLYIVFGVFGLIAIVALLVWLISRSSSNLDLFGSCIALSNIISMTLLIFLLGYGIAKLPKYLWHRANYQRTLSQYYFRAAGIYDDLEDAKEEYVSLLRMVRTLDMNIPEDDPNKKYIHNLESRFSKDITRLGVGTTETSSRDVSTCTYKSLVKLNSKIVNARRKYKTSSYQWEWLQKKIYFIEAILDAKKYSNEWKIASPFTKERTGPLSGFLNSKEYIWNIWIRPIVFKASAILFLAFALILIYCELSIFFQQALFSFLPIPNLSVFTLIKFIRFINNAQILVQGLSLLIIALLTYVVFFGLFKLKLFKLYVLIPHHSDSASLLFAAVVLTRVVPALCYNYLQLMGITDEDGVAYFDVMGSQKFEVKILGGLGNFFQYNFPIFIIIVTLLTLFDVPDRIGALFSIERFVYSKHEESERIREGKEVIATSKREKLFQMMKSNRSENTPISTQSPHYDSDNDIYAPNSVEFSDYDSIVSKKQNSNGNSKFNNIKKIFSSKKSSKKSSSFSGDDGLYSL